VISLKDSLKISFASVPEGKIYKLLDNTYRACKGAYPKGGVER
jgi:hypothetical protein